MSRAANVESVDALRGFRGAMLKFAEMASSAVHNAENDLHRTLIWLETEQSLHWREQMRKASEEVARAEEAVRMKRLYKGVDGKPQSTVEEEKALAIARRKLEYADAKQRNIKRYIAIVQKETMSFKGAVQRLMTAAQADIPNAVAKLDRLVVQLEEYVALATPGAAEGDVIATSDAPAEATSAPEASDTKREGSS